MGTTVISQAAIDVISRSITQHDTASGVQGSEDDFAGRARRQNFAGLRIDHFDHRQDPDR